MSKVVKCFDTVSREYVEVEVTDEIATFYKRDYWREEMSERRYHKRAIDLDGLYVVGDFYIEQKDCVLEEVMRNERLRRVATEVALLSETAQRLVRLVLVEGYSVTEAAMIENISISYASRIVKRAKCILRERLSDIR